MPVKIVNGPSDPENGEISQHDLFRIIEDFQNSAIIQSGFQRPIYKIQNVLVPINIIRKLIKEVNDDNYINIQFGVTLPNQKSCGDNFQTDISNQITVVINRAKESGQVVVDRTAVNDFVITTGFKTFDKALVDIPCCGKPGSGS